jgi:hypothetical protein
VLKQNNLMLRSEHRERLEAWATSDSLILHSKYWSALIGAGLINVRYAPDSDKFRAAVK